LKNRYKIENKLKIEDGIIYSKDDIADIQKSASLSNISSKKVNL
jgi:hypothetical protein